eukprot:6182388-Pleurochrysis_carterae.AAC.5
MRACRHLHREQPEERNLRDEPRAMVVSAAPGGDWPKRRGEGGRLRVGREARQHAQRDEAERGSGIAQHGRVGQQRR